MRILLFLLISCSAFAQLPGSGSLSIKGAAGGGRSISQEVDGNETGSKSLTTLSTSVLFSAPHSLLEFYSFEQCSVAPNIPTDADAAVGGVGNNDVTVTWTKDVFGDMATRFEIERNAQSDTGTWVFVIYVGYAASPSITDNDLPSDQYIYRVSAENSCGSSSALQTNSVKPAEFVYVDIPDADVSGTSATLTYSNPGNILNTTGGDTQNKKLSGTWDQFHAYSFVGTSGTHRKISNLDGTTVISSTNALSMFTIEGTNSDYFEINGLSASAPMYFVYGSGTAATAAVQSNAWSDGPHMWVQNAVNNTNNGTTTGGYGVFMNDAGTLSGGDANTPCVSSDNYQGVTLKFFRSFSPEDATNGRENFYIGRTTTTSYAIHHNFVAEHLLGYNSDWDGGQFGNCIDCSLSNLTFHTSGTDNTSAQDASIQLVNFSGIVENSLFYNGKDAARIAGYDIIWRNNYIHWTDAISVEILDYNLNYAEANRLFVDPAGVQILIEDSDFVAENWTGALLQVFDGEVNITIQNCKIEGPTTLFDDDRGASPTGTLTDGGGNTFVASGTIPAPTFTNFDPADFENHGLLTNAYHYNLGRGARTPPPAP